MKEIRYQEAVVYIEELPKFTRKHSLKHTETFMRCLGNPGLDKKIIHVAGTNGKGSVCAFLNAMLSAGKKSVGMFTSPHLIELRERISMNLLDISEQEFVAVFSEARAAANMMMDQGLEHPSYFEFLFGMAMTAFDRADVEYIILEAGLGGRKDATNIVQAPVASVLTVIDYDHTGILGDTLAEIASEKAGIIKSGTPVFCGINKCEVKEIIRKTAKEKECRCREISKDAYEIRKITDKDIAFSILSAYDEDVMWSLQGTGLYQVENAVLAFEVMKYLWGGYLEKEQCDIWRHALYDVIWPGRMEEAAPGVIIDGAHNIDAIQAAAASINAQRAEYDDLAIIFAVAKDKRYEEMVACLGRDTDADLFIPVALEGSRTVDAGSLSRLFRQYTGADVRIGENTTHALQMAMERKGKQGRVYCLGSLYLAGEVKEVLKGGISC